MRNELKEFYVRKIYYTCKICYEKFFTLMSIENHIEREHKERLKNEGPE